mmetsp:Transcript_24137/g.52267  ORF Transcript_24137/g.52267 Transcript_24137/m.52267 type:complete len:607 (-) Transcript_24137:87-1907(-)
MSKKAGYSRSNHLPLPRAVTTATRSSSAGTSSSSTRLRPSPRSSPSPRAGSAGSRTPRSSPPSSFLDHPHHGVINLESSSYGGIVADDGDNFHDNNLNGDDDDETRELSPKHALRRGVSVGSNTSSGGGGGFETLRAALGGLVIHNEDDEEMAELSPRSSKTIHGGTMEDGGEGSSLPHPEEVRSSASAAAAGAGASATTSGGGGSGGAGNARLNALLACMCPFVRLADAARRQGPAIFWRILPSILVTKAFWLSLLTLGLCDLATIVAVVDQDTISNNYAQQQDVVGDDDTADDTLELVTDDGDAVDESTGMASPGGDEDGDGMIKLTFGLWSYSTTPEDRSAGDDDVSFFEAEEERITTCTYHILAAEEGVVFFMDPIFRTARAFGIITVAVGFVTMVTLWTGVLKGGSTAAGASNHRSQRGRRKGHKKRGLRATVTIALILCSAFEGLTLLILNSGACGNKRMEREYGQIYRDCEIAEGSSSPITAIVFWFLTGLAMLKFPSDEPDDIPSPGRSTCEFGPNGREYGTGEEAEERGVEARVVKVPWWRRMINSGGASPLHRVDRRRVNGYTTELQFDETYEQDGDEEYETWRDNTMSLQMREIS